MTRVRVWREKLDRQGYTEAGRYFGVGEKLWFYDAGEAWGYVRAPSKREAMLAAQHDVRLGRL